MRLAASLALFVWAVGLASGLVAILADVQDAAATALIWGDLAVGGLLVLLAVRLAMPGFRKWRRGPEPAVAGPLLGALIAAVAGLVFALGIFLPYLAGWGGHELDDFGGSDFTWQEWLTFWLTLSATTGVVLGAVCGLAAWFLRFARLPLRRGAVSRRCPE